MAKKRRNRIAEMFEFLTLLFEDKDYYKRMPYYRYLNTPHWKHMREIKLLEIDNRCQICYNSTQLHVHHRTYERLGHEKLTDLTVLCKECHDLFHKNRKLKKNPENGG